MLFKILRVLQSGMDVGATVKELEYYCTILNNPNTPNNVRNDAENSLTNFRKVPITSPLLQYILGKQKNVTR